MVEQHDSLLLMGQKWQIKMIRQLDKMRIHKNDED